MGVSVRPYRETGMPAQAGTRGGFSVYLPGLLAKPNLYEE